jgi:hypothetical protein
LACLSVIAAEERRYIGELHTVCGPDAAALNVSVFLVETILVQHFAPAWLSFSPEQRLHVLTNVKGFELRATSRHRCTGLLAPDQARSAGEANEDMILRTNGSDHVPKHHEALDHC